MDIGSSSTQDVINHGNDKMNETSIFLRRGTAKKLLEDHKLV